MTGIRQHTSRDVLEWDVRSWTPALRFWERKLAGRQVVTALELGARGGGLTLWLSRHAEDVVFSDMDGDKYGAQALHHRFGVTNVRYEAIDARDIPYRDAFDVIAFKSVLGAVGGATGSGKAHQQRAFDEIRAALKPGGIVLFAENLAASPMHAKLRQRFSAWSANWRYVGLDELAEFTRAFVDVEIRTTGFAAAFGRTERQRSVLAMADQAVLMRLASPAWRYIAYGSAEKSRQTQSARPVNVSHGKRASDP